MSGKYEVNQATEARVLKHMNDDHAASIHAIARKVDGPWQGKISNAKLVSFTSDHYVISYVKCDGEVCSMEKKEIKFDEPIASDKEIREKFVTEHKRAFMPDLVKAFSERPVLILVEVLFITAYLSSNVEEMIASMIPISIPFLSASFFFWLTAFLHSSEATFIGMYFCKKAKLDIKSSFAWWIAILFCGFFEIRKIKELASKVAMQEKRGKSKDH